VRCLWIGCADSRVPANEIVGLAPGELFVHRNLANVVARDDLNMRSVLRYAVDVLRVGHIIVCGHYGYGGVRAALNPPTEKTLDSNVHAQVRAACGTDVVAAAWAGARSLVVHGWIYDLSDGILRDLDLSSSAPSA
jgi:carbonic anhydrase